MTATVLKAYFDRNDTPAAGSPVGRLMVKIVEKYPGIALEDARERAKSLLLIAAGSRKYHFPRVYSETEIAEQRQRLKAFREKAL